MNPKVLLIEDEPMTQQMVRAQLATFGCRVTVASDAVCAVGAARRDRPDVIVLDIGLPGGDGLTVIGRLQSLGTTAGIPIVVLSGRDATEYAPRCLAAGAVCFLPKPPEPEVLRDAIERAIGGPGA